MKKYIIFLFIFFLLNVNISAEKIKKNDKESPITFHVYILAGQSNMEGYGYVFQLPDELSSVNNKVMIFHGSSSPDMGQFGGRGIWAELRPGHGVGFKANMKRNIYSGRFGIELSFAKHLNELDPEANIAIIKYARGGTSIDPGAKGTFGCWDPDYKNGKGKNQYDHFIATLQNAFEDKDLNNDGVPDILIPAGIIWMQGEADGDFTKKIAERYEVNLKNLITYIRSYIGIKDLPVVIGRISDSGRGSNNKVWEYGDIIREAQKKIAESDGKAFLVTSTDEYDYSDPWHYDSKGYIDLGKKFAEAVFNLNGK